MTSRDVPDLRRLAQRAAALSVLALSLAACEPTVNLHGARYTESNVARIEPGVSTRDDVVRLLGTPSALATFDDRTWYYVSQRTEQLTFYQTELTGQEVLAIRFAPDGTVERIERADLAAATPVDPITKTTPTYGTEQSLIADLLGNIGKFNPAPGRDTFADRNRSVFGRSRNR